MAFLGAIGGAAIQASAAKRAAQSQERMGERDIAYQEKKEALIRSDLAPFRAGGAVSQSAYDFELGLGPRPMIGGTPYGGYTKTPGYDFRLKQGQDSIEAGAAARGGLYSGAAMKALQENGQDYATSEYGSYMNRLAGRADSGMAAAQMSGNVSQQAAGAVSNALGNIGNAQAAGYVGVGRAINSGIENGIGAWQYQANMKKGMTPYGWTR